MAFTFPSDEWAEAYKKAINENKTYREVGRDWTFGVVAMVVKADPALGIEEDTAMWLDIERGACRECKILPARDATTAEFVIVADYAKWKSVIKRELDPIKGMMQNKLKLTKGHMPTIVRFVHSQRELVETTSRVPTIFRDDP